MVNVPIVFIHFSYFLRLDPLIRNRAIEMKISSKIALFINCAKHDEEDNILLSSFKILRTIVESEFTVPRVHNLDLTLLVKCWFFFSIIVKDY